MLCVQVMDSPKVTFNLKTMATTPVALSPSIFKNILGEYFGQVPAKSLIFLLLIFWTNSR